MATTLQFRRMTTAQLASFTGASGEIIVNMETNELTLHDGVTAGGTIIGKQPVKELIAGTSRIIREVDGILVDSNNQPMREIAINCYRIVPDYLREHYYGPDHWNFVADDSGSWSFDPQKGASAFDIGADGKNSQNYWQHAFTDMRNAGFRYCRIFIGTAHGQDIRAFWSTPELRAETLGIIRKIVDIAYYNGIGILPAIFQHYYAIPAYCDERIFDAMNPGSASWTLMQEIAAAVVTELADHPGICGWEVGNEFSFSAWGKQHPDLSKNGTIYGPATNHWDTTDVMTVEQMRGVYAMFDNLVRSLDPHGRFTATGDIGAFGGKGKSVEVFKNELVNDNPGQLTPSIHLYTGNTLTDQGATGMKDYLVHLRQACKDAGKSFYIGEWGSNQGISYDFDGRSGMVNLRNIGQAIYNSGVQLAFFWDWHQWPQDMHLLGGAMDISNEYSLDNPQRWAVLEVQNLMERMRSNEQKWIDPYDLQTLSLYNAPGGVEVAATSDVTALQTTPNKSLLYPNGGGFSTSFQIRITDPLDAGTHKNVLSYGLSNEEFFGVGIVNQETGSGVGDPTTSPHGGLWFTAYSVSQGFNTNVTTAVPSLLDGEWHTIMFTLNLTDTGRRGVTIWFDGFVVYKHDWGTAHAGKALPDYSNAKLTLFSSPWKWDTLGNDVWNARPGKCGFKNLRFWKAPVRERFIWEYMYFDLPPTNFTTLFYPLNGSLLDSNGENLLSVPLLNGAPIGPNPTLL